MINWKKTDYLSLEHFLRCQVNRVRGCLIGKRPIKLGRPIDGDYLNVFISSTRPSALESYQIFAGENSYWCRPDEYKFVDLLVLGGWFKSKSDARNAGWDRPIDDGYNDYEIGKLKRRLCIWKPKAVYAN